MQRVPCLFEEMAINISSRFVLDEPIDDASLALPEESDPAFGNADTKNGWPHPISEVNTPPQMLDFEKSADSRCPSCCA